MLAEGEQGGASATGAGVPVRLGRDSTLDAFVPRRRRTDISDGGGIAETAPSGTTKRRDAVFRRLLALADVLHPGATRLILFHIVAQGSCWVATTGGDRHWTHEGDVIVLPYGDQHTMGGEAPAESVPIVSLLDAPPWDALRRVSDELDLPMLADVADVLRLSVERSVTVGEITHRLTRSAIEYSELEPLRLSTQERRQLEAFLRSLSGTSRE